MVYTKNSPWQNAPSTATPLSASRLQRLEDGTYDASVVADNALAAAQPEVIHDLMALFLKAGSYLTLAYDDANNTLTFDLSTGVLREFLQDEVNAFLLAGTNVSKVYDDANGTLTLSAIGGGGSGAVSNASETVAGIIELATQQEVTDGSGATLAVTPVTLAARLTAFLAAIKGTPNNLATLDGNGKLVTSQLPELAIVRPFPVADQAAMLALTAQVGDVAIRADVPENYILRVEPASVFANWTKLNGGASAVSSVAGRIGAVTLTSADITNFAAAVAAQDIIEGQTWAGALTVIDRSSTNQPARGSLRAGRRVLWVAGTGDPTNAVAGDLVLDLAPVAPALATRVFNGDLEGLSLADGTTITTTNTAYSTPNIGGGSNTLVYSTVNPVTGTASARFVQATGGAVNTLGKNNLTAITDWAVQLDFNLESNLPAASMVLLRGYNDNAYTSTASSFSVIVSTAGLITVQTGVGAAAGTELTSTGTNLVAGTKYRFQIDGVVATNKLSVKLDTGPGTTALWSATVTPAAGHEIAQITSARMGIGNSSCNLTMAAEMQIGTGARVLGCLMANYRFKHPILGWVDLINPREKLADGSYAALNITPRWIPPSGGTAPAPDGFILNTTRPSRANTGITPGTTLTTMSPAIAAQYGTIQVATSTACAKWIPDAGVTLSGLTIPWPVQNTQANVTLNDCNLIGPQDITGGIATDTRNNPNLGVVANHAAGGSITLNRCDVIPSTVWSGSTGIIGHHYTANRCYIRDVTDAFGAYNINGSVAGVKLYGNFAERLTFFNNDPRQSNGITHNDFLQMQGGSDHDAQGNFFKGTWSPRADIPAGSSTLDPMGSGDTIANAAGGGARLFTGTPNVSPLSNVNIQYNWGLGGITYSLVIPASQQASSSGLGTFANNRDYGYHRVVSLGGFTEQVGIAHHELMPWNSDWAGKSVGGRYLDTTHGNQAFTNFNDTNGTQSMIRVQNS